MGEFVFAAEASSLPPGHGRTVYVKGRGLALFNVGGEFYAIDDECPHKGGPLGSGGLTEGQVFCPLHGWGFDVKSGSCLSRPDRPVKAYLTRVVDGQVQVCV